MRRQCTVTALAADALVVAAPPDFNDIRMALRTGGTPGEMHRHGGNVVKRTGAEMTKIPETRRHQQRPEDDEHQQAALQDCTGADQVLSVDEELLHFTLGKDCDRESTAAGISSATSA